MTICSTAGESFTKSIERKCWPFNLIFNLGNRTKSTRARSGKEYVKKLLYLFLLKTDGLIVVTCVQAHCQHEASVIFRQWAFHWQPHDDLSLLQDNTHCSYSITGRRNSWLKKCLEGKHLPVWLWLTVLLSLSCYLGLTPTVLIVTILFYT